MRSDSASVIFGAYPFNTYTPQHRVEFLDTLKKYGVTEIDTAAGYPDSEKLLGQIGAPKDFTIHTKIKAFTPGSLVRGNVVSCALLSLWDLKVDQVDVLFLHSPDSETPIEETLGAIQELYVAGKFKRFGLSNFKPEGVQEAYDVAKSKGYVLPTVYQGNYNPVSRAIEADLFPLLKKLNIAFFAYSPLAGGFLTKNANDITNGVKGGRFDKDSFIGQMYHKLYNRPSLVAALEKWENIANEAGISKAALAYRWMAYHSALKPKDGDALIVGASRPSQLDETLKNIEDGPLDDKIAKGVADIWEGVKDEAPLDNYHY